MVLIISDKYHIILSKIFRRFRWVGWIDEVAPRFFVFGFGWNQPNGALGKEIHEFIRYGISGIDLFPRNLSDPVQLWVELNHLVNFAGRKLIIATDQEGGGFSSLKRGFTVGVPPMALRAGNDPELARRQGEIFSKELSTVGVNTIFAPILDVNTSIENPIIGIRSFSDDPDDVIFYAEKFMEGLKKHDLKVCVKHFPGHGPTSEDSHEDLPVVKLSEEEYRAIHLKPFQEIIKNDLVDMVMTAHVLYPSVDDKPGTISKRFITAILREEIGFDGLVISDCLEMKAMKEHYGIEKATVEAFNAGVDLILISHSPDDQRKSMSALKDAMESGFIPKWKIEKSLERLERFLNDLPEFPEDVEKMLNFSKDENFENLVASKSVFVLERKRILPLKPNRSVIILYSKSDEEKAEFFVEKLKTKVARIERMDVDEDDTRILETCSNFDTVILLTRSKSKSSIEILRMRSILESIGKESIHISLFNPYDMILLCFTTVSIASFGSEEHQLEAVAKVLLDGRHPNSVLPLRWCVRGDRCDGEIP